MPRSNWLFALRPAKPYASRRRTSQSSWRSAAVRRPIFEPLEERTPLAVLTVNSPLDNATPGDGMVTLREAIIAANTNATTDLGQTASGADTIEFAPSVTGTIALMFGEMIITESLTINGPGRDLLTIDAQRNSRIFNVAVELGEPGDYTFRGLTLTGGNTTGEGGAVRIGWATTLTIDQCRVHNNTSVGDGGGVYFRSPSFTITNSIVTGNTATGPGARGGGFFVPSSFSTGGLLTSTVSDSTISGNSATEAGGGFVVINYLTLTNTVVSENSSGSGGGFRLTPGVTGRGGFVIVNNCTITGNTATFDGGGFTAPFVRITDSVVSENTAGRYGGGFVKTGNFPTYDPLNVTRTTIQGNSAGLRGGGFLVGADAVVSDSTITENYGGGIYGGFRITINSSTISDNIATGPGGGIHLTPNIGASGTLVLNSSVVSRNTSPSKGGGIYAPFRVSVTLNSSTVSGNESVGSGGGIYGGDVILNSSTVSGNRSNVIGGGIFGGKVVLNSSTVSGNSAATNGGGVYSERDGIDITHSTVTRNSAMSGDGGGIWNKNSPINVFASIVARNTAGGGSPDLRPGTGTLTVEYSLIGDNAGTNLAESHTPDVNGNLIGSAAGSGVIDPRLAPLANSGGRTSTHALLPGSPAIDAVVLPIAPDPTHDYQLNGSYADALGGPSLVPLGGRLSSSRYEFERNQGLNLSNALVIAGNYSLELLFRWNIVTAGWQKLIDFKNLTSNAGLYRDGSQVLFSNRATASNVFQAGVTYRLILTRDAETNLVRAFLNAAEIWSFVDAAGEAIFDSPDQIIRFFQDDHTTGQLEAASGSVDVVRIYNHALTDVEVKALGDPLPIVLPPYDQRGEPFARVAEGDGANGAWADMGAYEAQHVPSFATGDYNQNGIVDAADYVIWRKTLTQNVPNGTGADGNGDGVVDDDDHGVWRTNFGRTQATVAAAAIGQNLVAAADVAVDEATQPLVRSDVKAGTPNLPQSSTGAETQNISPRGSAYRTVRRQLEAAASPDDALLAFTAAPLAEQYESHSWPSARRQPESAARRVDELLSEFIVRDLSRELPDAFDRAIELLGAL